MMSQAPRPPLPPQFAAAYQPQLQTSYQPQPQPQQGAYQQAAQAAYQQAARAAYQQAARAAYQQAVTLPPCDANGGRHYIAGPTSPRPPHHLPRHHHHLGRPRLRHGRQPPLPPPSAATSVTTSMATAAGPATLLLPHPLPPARHNSPGTVAADVAPVTSGPPPPLQAPPLPLPPPTLWQAAAAARPLGAACTPLRLVVLVAEEELGALPPGRHQALLRLLAPRRHIWHTAAMALLPAASAGDSAQVGVPCTFHGLRTALLRQCAAHVAAAGLAAAGLLVVALPPAHPDPAAAAATDSAIPDAGTLAAAAASVRGAAAEAAGRPYTLEVHDAWPVEALEAALLRASDAVDPLRAWRQPSRVGGGGLG